MGYRTVWSMWKHESTKMILKGSNHETSFCGLSISLIFASFLLILQYWQERATNITTLTTALHLEYQLHLQSVKNKRKEANQNLQNKWIRKVSTYQVIVCWDVTSNSLVYSYQCFKATCHLHLQGRKTEGINSKFSQNAGTCIPDYVQHCFAETITLTFTAMGTSILVPVRITHKTFNNVYSGTKFRCTNFIRLSLPLNTVMLHNQSDQVC
jgi:hypothetical protein